MQGVRMVNRSVSMTVSARQQRSQIDDPQFLHLKALATMLADRWISVILHPHKRRRPSQINDLLGPPGTNARTRPCLQANAPLQQFGFRHTHNVTDLRDSSQTLETSKKWGLCVVSSHRPLSLSSSLVAIFGSLENQDINLPLPPPHHTQYPPSAHLILINILPPPPSPHVSPCSSCLPIRQ